MIINCGHSQISLLMVLIKGSVSQNEAGWQDRTGKPDLVNASSSAFFKRDTRAFGILRQLITSFIARRCSGIADCVDDLANRIDHELRLVDLY
jgi:hypothetical protein